MPLPALPVLAAIFIAKAAVTGAGYILYKNRDKLPQGHWRDEAHKDLRKDSSDEGQEHSNSPHSENPEDNSPDP